MFVFILLQNLILVLLAAGVFVSWQITFTGHKKFVLLAAYMSVNFIIEFIVKKIMLAGVVNHYLYAANILLHSGCLLAYIFIQPQQNVYRVIPLLSFFYFCFWYFTNKLWRSDSLFSKHDFTNYYGILSICSITWVWITVKNKSGNQLQGALHLAVCFLLYHLLGLVNNSISIVKTTMGPFAKQYFFWAPLASIVLFYLLLLVLFIKVQSSLKPSGH